MQDFYINSMTAAVRLDLQRSLAMRKLAAVTLLALALRLRLETERC